VADVKSRVAKDVNERRACPLDLNWTTTSTGRSRENTLTEFAWLMIVTSTWKEFRRAIATIDGPLHRILAYDDPKLQLSVAHFDPVAVSRKSFLKRQSGGG
jgi:hypothetical protein